MGVGAGYVVILEAVMVRLQPHIFGAGAIGEKVARRAHEIGAWLCDQGAGETVLGGKPAKTLLDEVADILAGCASPEIAGELAPMLGIERLHSAGAAEARPVSRRHSLAAAETRPALLLVVEIHPRSPSGRAEAACQSRAVRTYSEICAAAFGPEAWTYESARSEEHTSEPPALHRNSHCDFDLKKKNR